MESSFSRRCTVDSYVSRRFPIFYLKNRRIFTLFTNYSPLHDVSSLVVLTQVETHLFVFARNA